MPEPLPLKFTCTIVCMRALLQENLITSESLTGESDTVVLQTGPEDLSGTYLTNLLETDCFTAVSDNILHRIVKYCPTKLTNRLLHALIPHHVRELNLDNCQNVRLMGLVETLKKCFHIHWLNLTGCTQLIHPDVFTFTGLANIPLTTVILEENRNVTDEVVHAMLTNLQHLERVDLSMCVNITDSVFLLNEDLQTLREVTPEVLENDKYECHLTHVDISGCRQLTSAAVAHLTSLCGPSLQHVNMSWTLITCISLLHLGGYSLPAIIDFLLTDPDLKSDKELKNILQYYRELRDTYVDQYSSKTSDTERLTELYQELSVSETEMERVRELTTQVSEELEHLDTGQLLGEQKEDITESTGQDLGKQDEETAGLEQYDKSSVKLEIIEVDGFGDEKTEEYSEMAVEQPSELEETQLKAATRMVNLQSENYPEVADTPGHSDIVQNDNHEEQIVSKETKAHLGPGASFTEMTNYRPCSYKKDYAVVMSSAEFLNKEISENNDDSVEVNDGEIQLSMCDDDGDSDGESDEIDLANSPDSACARGVACDKHRLDMSLNKGYYVVWKGKELNVNDRTETVENAKGEFKDDAENREGSQECCDTGSGMKDDEMSRATDFKSNDSEASEERKSISAESCNESNFEDQDLNKTDTVDQPNKEKGKLGKSGNFVPVVSEKLNFTYASQLYTPQIANLNIAGAQFVSRRPNLGQLCLEKFLLVNRGLKHFNISWKGLTQDFFKKIVSSLSELVEVDIEECTMLQPVGVATLAKNCTKLQTVNLRGVVFITDGSLTPFLMNKNLENLSLAEAVNITDAVLKCLAQHLSDSLKSLDLSWCEEVTEQGINAVCSSCTKLQKLWLRKCPVSDFTLKVLAETCQDIEELSIESADSNDGCILTDDAIITIANNFTKLSVIDISWNLSITDVSLSAILGNCSMLEEANFKGLKQITIQPFLPMISGYEEDIPQNASDVLPQRSTVYAPNLRVLDLDYSDLVNDALLQRIVNVCRGTLQVTDYYGQKLIPE